VRDRVVQTAIKTLLEPTLEKLFSDHSYGFRPGRNQRQAVEAAQAAVKSGKTFVVDIDLSKFFDRVSHDRLISRLSMVVDDKRILRIIGITLRSGIMKDGLYRVTTEGTTQGSPLSPILSNFVLDELDKELERRGLRFARFADDCNIFVGSQLAAERVMASVSAFIEGKLKLKVNDEKSQVARSKKVKFLGITIDGRGCRMVSGESMERARRKAVELTPRGTHLPLEKSVELINQWYVGWSNYYKMTQYPKQLLVIEKHIRRRLRARFVAQAKRRRYLYRKLRRQGCSHGEAKTVYSNHGPWALSKTMAVNRAFTNAWFKQQGLKDATSKWQKGWLGFKKTPWI
jgi:group II intron reverse transcriptase/maturase